MLINETQMTINRSFNLSTGLKMYEPVLVLRSPFSLSVTELEDANFVVFTCHPPAFTYSKINNIAALSRAQAGESVCWIYNEVGKNLQAFVRLINSVNVILWIEKSIT